MHLIQDLGMLYPSESSKLPKRYGLYLCDCRASFKCITSNIKNGNTKGCNKCTKYKLSKALTNNTNGAFNKNRLTHGDTANSLYHRYNNMIARCYNKNNPRYNDYGGKGVTVCKEWLSSYEAFKGWALANGYKEHLQIDKDKLCEALGVYQKIYSPKTCCWLTPEENTRQRDKEQ